MSRADDDYARFFHLSPELLCIAGFGPRPRRFRNYLSRVEVV